MEKGFPLVSEGDGAVVKAVRAEHWFVTCDVVLMFFAVPKQQSITFFEIGIQNWQSSSLPLFV